jgi:DNA-nicking Smr family endonuclease
LKQDAEPDAAATGRPSSRRSNRQTTPAANVQAVAAVPVVERRKARRIAAGVIEIEARLDLHGMTQTAAHRRLVGFVQGAVARGLRTVLVITGKGGPRQQPPAGAAWWEVDEIGVLRRSVPRWLAEPPLRELVIGCQPASPRHGGDGALYILLKRMKPSGRNA